jgi:hypothetical protein
MPEDYPNEKLLDYFTSNYDALKKISEQLDALIAKTGISPDYIPISGPGQSPNSPQGQQFNNDLLIFVPINPGAGVFYTPMVDCSQAKNLLFYVQNSSDVAVTVQAIGNISTDTGSAVAIDGVIGVAAVGGFVSVGINLQGDDWHPYIGLMVTIPAGATIGTVAITRVVRS